MSAFLDLIAPSWIIPYTLVPESQTEEEVSKVVDSFIENLTISKYWRDQSLNNCDFSGLLDSIKQLKSPKLNTLALRFIKPVNSSDLPQFLELAKFSHIRKIDVERIRKLDTDLTTMTRNYFLDACYQNRADLAQLFIQKGFDPSVNDNSAIKMASRNGHAGIVQLLLNDSRVDPSAEDNFAIKWASKNGHTEIVRLLLEQKSVDPCAQNNFAFGWASENGHTEIVRLLLGNPKIDPMGGDNRALIWASRNGHIEIVTLLLENPKVDPTAGDNDALIWASRNGHIEIVRLLLENPKVDPTARDNSPIAYAGSNGHVEVVKLLLERDGVDPTAEENFAFRHASKNGHVEVVRLLLERVGVEVVQETLATGRCNQKIRAVLNEYLEKNSS